MRLSEFGRAVEAEFGARGASLVSDLTLRDFGYRTAAQALDDGEPAREVWLALCDENDVPDARRHGAGWLEPRKR